MDDDGGLGIRNWGSYYDQPRKGLGLQLMSSVAPERDTKPLLSNGAFLLHQHRGGVPEPAIPIEYMRTSDGRWIHHQRDSNKILHVLPGNHHHPNYAAVLADNPHAHTHTHTHTHTHNPHAHTLQMLQQSPPPPDPSNDDRAAPPMDEAGGGSRKDMPPKKRSSQGRPGKSPKAKKPKKAPAPRDESNDNGSAPKVKAARKSAGLVINGIDMDISRLPTPVCSCTGTPQPCYRWGIGGWQSACCTTSMSMYPLPMSTKRRGARIAGRKMSQGAFKKVLERLAGEGYNLSNPIDLRAHWAKHGTNKFVTIREEQELPCNTPLGMAGYDPKVKRTYNHNLSLHPSKFPVFLIGWRSQPILIPQASPSSSKCQPQVNRGPREI